MDRGRVPEDRGRVGHFDACPVHDRRERVPQPVQAHHGDPADRHKRPNSAVNASGPTGSPRASTRTAPLSRYADPVASLSAA